MENKITNAQFSANNGGRSLRVLGRVVNTINNKKKTVGYIIMNEASGSYKAYSESQARELIKRMKFVNATIEDGKIINTECSMDRLPEFDMQLNVISAPGIIVIAKIIREGDKPGNDKAWYKILTTNGKICNLTTEELFKYYDNGVELINAKVAHNGRTRYISAIRGEFNKITLPNTVNKNGNNTDTSSKEKSKEYRKSRHRERMIFAYERFIRQLLRKNPYNDEAKYKVTAKVLYTYNRAESRQEYNLKKEYRIAFSEMFKSEESHDIAKKMLSMFSIDNVYTSNTLLSALDIIKILSIAQCIFENRSEDYMINAIIKPAFSRNEKACMKNCRKVSAMFKKLIDSELATKKMKRFIHLYLEEIRSRNWSVIGNTCTPNSSREFKVISFESEQGANQLGFTFSESQRGKSITTNDGYHCKLKFLGDYMNEYPELRFRANNIGELLRIAYIERLLSLYKKYYVDSTTYGAAISKEDIVAYIEIIIAISFMVESEVGRAISTYIGRNMQRLEEIGVQIPDNTLKLNRGEVPEEIFNYIDSGFCVFLNDINYRKCKKIKAALKTARVVNYRMRPITTVIQHPMLIDELVPFVALVTSDNCSMERINRLIGRLRFI